MAGCWHHTSMRAHLKIGWKEVGDFVFNQAAHAIFSYTASG
jgi:hypothetical protein